MFHLSKNEACVVLIGLCVILTGSGLNFIGKKYPQILQLINVVDHHGIYPWYDVNKASVEQLVQIPYIGNYTAHAIVRLRQEQGAIHDIEMLKEIPGVRESNYERFAPYLRVRRLP